VPALLLSAFAVGYLLPRSFLEILLLYWVFTSFYSFFLKKALFNRRGYPSYSLHNADSGGRCRRFDKYHYLFNRIFPVPVFGARHDETCYRTG